MVQISNTNNWTKNSTIAAWRLSFPQPLLLVEQTFGSWVKKRRKALDLTQQELATQVGCSVSLILKIESDSRRPSRQIAGLLAEKLDIPADQRPLFLKIARQEAGLQNLDALPPLSPYQSAPVSDHFQSSLPVPPTPLIGREHEIGMVLYQLRDPSCRLLTLTGPGGVGKTRLALEAAGQLHEAFTHGVYFVSLVGTTSPEFIVPAIAESMRFVFSSLSDPNTQLLQFLAGKQTLLVLDNLEHLLNGVGLLTELLEGCRDLKFLATSREKLNLQAEWSIAVQGLPIPSDVKLENWGSNSAVSLFLQRSKQAHIDFTLSEEDIPYIRRICELVEGLPLGLELAATWVRTLSCREIASEIEKSVDFLTATARDMPLRHRSMRAVFEYSWRLLTDEEQQVLKQLSAFRGGFTRAAAKQVAGATLPLLASLVDKSLVWHTDAGRYELHELIRQFAFEQLIKGGEMEETCNRHFEFFLSLAEESRQKLRGGDQLIWLNLLEQDYDNLRAALEWSLRFEKMTGNIPQEAEDTIQASFKLAGALNMFWRIRNHWGEGRNWLQRILSQTAKQTVTRERARALNSAVLLATEQADLNAAQQLSDENLSLAKTLGNPHVLARALHAQGVVLWKQKDYQAAHDSCEQAVALFRSMGNRLAMAGSLQLLGRIATNQNNLDLADRYLRECVDLFREFSNAIELHASLSDLGLLAYLRNDLSTAYSCHEKSLEYFRQARNIAGVEMSLNRLGDLARCEGNYDEAEKLYNESWTIYRETGDKDEIASLLHNLGYVALHRGDQKKALSLFEDALGLQRELDNEAGVAECLMGIACVKTATGQHTHAARLFGLSEFLRENANAVLWPANRIEYDQSLASLRKSLDGKTLAENWEAGRHMAVDQVIAETFV